MLAAMRKTGSEAQTIDYNEKSKIGTKSAQPNVSVMPGAVSGNVQRERINRTPIAHFHAFYCILAAAVKRTRFSTKPSSAFKLE